LPLAAAVVVAVSLSPPVDARAHSDLVWHMSQHLLLLSFAGPLLAAGLRGRRNTPATVAGASLLAVVAVAGWHAPVLFDAADRSLPLHMAEHASFIVGSGALWWLAGSELDAPAPYAVIAVFVVSLAGTALGVAMTLSRAPWYAAYPDVTDQQIAGALMWSVGGAVTTACALVVLVRTLRTTTMPT
jgi:cytochrome c oxidase assembly factor CtaG